MARFLHRREDFRALHAPYSALLAEHYARRGPDVLSALPYPESREAWEAGRGDLRRRLLRALGLDPQWVAAPPAARGPVPARTTGSVDRSEDGYRIELLELQTAPRVYASALLYLPADVAPGAAAGLPAVYSPHGHYRTGKHTRSIQIRCANLARRGYAVLIMDAVGHAERTFMGHRDPAAHALLYAGASLPGLQVLDNIRGLDYLQSRPEVDPARPHRRHRRLRGRQPRHVPRRRGRARRRRRPGLLGGDARGLLPQEPVRLRDGAGPAHLRGQTPPPGPDRPPPPADHERPARR